MNQPSGKEDLCANLVKKQLLHTVSTVASYGFGRTSVLVVLEEKAHEHKRERVRVRKREKPQQGAE